MECYVKSIRQLFRYQLLASLVLSFLVLLFAGHFLKYSLVQFIWPLSDKADWVTWQQQNEKAVQSAEVVLQSHVSTLHASRSTLGWARPILQPHRPVLALTLVTVSRSVRELGDYEPRYLTQVLARFVQLLERYRRHPSAPHLTLLLCNVDGYPQYHVEASRLQTLTGLGGFVKYSGNESHDKDILQKETEDYVFCLRKSFSIPSVQYVVLVEDDALPHEDSLQVLMHTIHEYLEVGCSTARKTVAFLKLYHPERLQTYISWELHRWQELLLLAGAGASLLSPVVLQCRRQRGPALRLPRFALVWLTVFLCLSLVTCVIGRQYLLQLRSLASPWLHRVVPAPGCCTPATLYPRHTHAAVTRYLSQLNQSMAKDEALDRMTRQLGLRGLLLEPNLFSHIGVYSSIRAETTNPKYVN